MPSQHNALITCNDIPAVTDAQIRALRDEAAAVGDTCQVESCDDALAGDTESREQCAKAINAAAAMADS